MMNGPGVTPEVWLVMGAWILALGVLVWLLVREPHHRDPRDEALDILRARFARGEISRDEFEAARRLVDNETHAHGRAP